MQDGQKAVWSIPYVYVAFFSSLKHNDITYRSYKVSSHPVCIFEIYQLWQSGFSWVYSNCCCSCSFKSEIIKIGQSSHKMCSNNILNSLASMTILNAYTKKSLETYWLHHIYIWYICIKRILHEITSKGWYAIKSNQIKHLNILYSYFWGLWFVNWLCV